MKLYPLAFVAGTIGALWQAFHAGPQVPLWTNIAAVIVAICFTGFGMSWLRYRVSQWLAKRLDVD